MTKWLGLRSSSKWLHDSNRPAQSPWPHSVSKVIMAWLVVNPARARLQTRLARLMLRTKLTDTGAGRKKCRYRWPMSQRRTQSRLKMTVWLRDTRIRVALLNQSLTSSSMQPTKDKTSRASWLGPFLITRSAAQASQVATTCASRRRPPSASAVGDAG